MPPGETSDKNLAEDLVYSEQLTSDELALVLGGIGADSSDLETQQIVKTLQDLTQDSVRGKEEIERYVERYRERLINESKEVALTSGSQTYSDKHVVKAGDSLSLSRRDGSASHTLVGLGFTLIGTGLGIFATAFTSAYVVGSIAVGSAVVGSFVIGIGIVLYNNQRR